MYSEKIDVKITAPNSGYEIWYTLDGSSPSSDSGFKYTKSFSIDTTVVVKARLIKKGYLPGPIVTSTYLLHDHFTLPVISISLNPADLWNEEYGLYTMYHRPYEKPAHFEYFSPEGKLKLGLDLGLRITGYTSRILPKKSFRILARDKYGPNNLEYHFFKDIENDKFGGLVIRADVTAAQGGGPHEIAGERIKNEIIYRFNRDMHSTVDMQAYQPVVVFLNGKYWGLYTLMERKAGEFIRNHHDVGEVDLIDDEDLDVMEGDDKHYIKMLSIMNNEDIRDPAVYAKIEGMMEIENFIDNWIYNIYMNAFDHEVNTRCWRPKTPEGKWHWIAFDKDGWGEYYESLLKDLAEIEVAEANLILGRLLKNEKFKLHFINRTCDYLNTVMRPEMVNRYIDEIAEVIKNEKPRDRKLWFEKVKYIVTGEQIAWMKEFGEKRPEHLRNEMRKIFKLPLEATLTFSSSPPGSGIIKVSTITPYAFPWTGVYFRETPIRLEAIPSPGYHFGEWNVNGASKESLISYIPKGDTEIKALFSK